MRASSYGDPSQDPFRRLRQWGNLLWWIGLIVLALLAVGLLSEIIEGSPDAFDSVISGLLGGALLAGVPLTAGYFMRRKAGPAPVNPERPKKPLSAIRIVFRTIGAIVMILVGGLQIWLMGNYFFDRSLVLFHPYPVIIFGSPLFVIGLLIWFLAIKVGRR